MAEELRPLVIQPGIYTEASDRAALNRYKAGSNIRFFKGFAEKVKGWAKLISDATFVGICRALLSWNDLTGQQWVALGTHLKLYLTEGAAFFDITPLEDDGTLGADPFTTTNGSHVVTVADVAHGLEGGQHVHFSGATAVATLDMNGEWVVDTVPTVDTYTFVHTGTANAGASGGGAGVDYEYELNPGLESSIIGGYGSGAWGFSTWGTPRTGQNQQCRTWSMDNWGEDLIATPYRGAIYVWVVSGGATVRAQVITQAPAQNLFALVSEKDRHLISFGAYDGTLSAIDPMLIKWCDAEDYTQWTPALSNSAGDKRLDRGNGIVFVVKSRGQFVIVTDRTLFTMAFSGDDFVFTFVGEGEAIGGGGPNCGVDIAGVVHYMGRGQFVKFTGQIEQLPCDVQSFVFTVDADKGFLGQNTMQSAKFFCARNKSKNEIVWFYCSAASDEIDRCVGYCFEDGHVSWWLGSVSCTAFLDENTVVEEPLGVHADGYLYVHETGVDADTAAMAYSLETYDLEIGTGVRTMLIRRLLPDFRRIVGNSHVATLQGRKEPTGRVMRRTSKFGALRRWIGAKMRARQISVKISGDSLGDDISLGVWRVDDTEMGQK